MKPDIRKVDIKREKALPEEILDKLNVIDAKVYSLMEMLTRDDFIKKINKIIPLDFRFASSWTKEEVPMRLRRYLLMNPSQIEKAFKNVGIITEKMAEIGLTPAKIMERKIRECSINPRKCQTLKKVEEIIMVE